MRTEEELVKLIEYHNDLYWKKNTPEILDIEYDMLLQELGDINPNHSLITQIHTPEVAINAKKVKHNNPMLSLNKAYSLEEVLAWAKKYIRNNDELFRIQPKFDGISANYENGILATRGDGEFGENVTDKLPLIELESEGYRGKLNRDVRGEIIIRDDDFKEKYNTITRKDGRLYKNSRNAVAGIIGLKTIKLMLAQNAKVTLIDYEYISHTVKFAQLAEKWDEILSKLDALPYPMDGIVIKLADATYAESLGNTAHHPRGQIAFKFTGIKKETKLLNVNWSFGKNCLTPVAELEPVELGGVTIRHATLHNYQNILDKDIAIGDIVTLERAGDVIPYIISSKNGEHRKSCIISECPSCGQELKLVGPELTCQNDECFEICLQRLLAAIRSIGIERLGEPNVRKMMESLEVKSLKDVFELSKDDIAKLDGFKTKSIDNLYNEIQKRKVVNDYELLAALNIAGIGKTIAKTILKTWTIAELQNLSLDELSSLDGIGPERAKGITEDLITNATLIEELTSIITTVQTKGQIKEDSKKICFTGKMPEKRSVYEKLASDNGFEPFSKVTKELDILVAMDISKSSSKLKKAEKAGIQIMDLETWLNSIK